MTVPRSSALFNGLFLSVSTESGQSRCSDEGPMDALQGTMQNGVPDRKAFHSDRAQLLNLSLALFPRTSF